ncbi:hypothetical protein [Actinomadura sp. WMMA1423]|uniref:hypothetical protein n=1 Tax=Actinomadura sp. WMMA1423 TaxID=2591108 RepID=UPI00197B03C5|nr:hypothetical protein [Actinomadura sp. WMMA1423]
MRLESPSKPPPGTGPPTGGGPARSLLRNRAVLLTALGWVSANVLMLVLADRRLPLHLHDAAERSTSAYLVDFNIRLAEVFFIMALAFVLTRRRARPDLAARAPERTMALRETLLLLAYGAGGLALGFAVGRAFGWHPFALHLAGSVTETDDHVERSEAIAWAAYNLVVFAIVPLAYFWRRYPARALNLVSTDRRGDLRLIVVVLLVEGAVQVTALHPKIFALDARQLLLGVPLTFVLYMAGTVLPTMVFVYAILIPRFVRLTGSVATTVIFGGLAYAALHLWDSWAEYGSPRNAAISIAFLLLTYFGPGMVKAWLTVRTGNAWVHVWAYHALAPHTLVDTPHVAHIFGIHR